ncbi:MAG: alpha/beta hydrolase [Myxococcota bacterium]
MSILDHPIITRRYFFPRAGAPEQPWIVDVGDAQLSGWRASDSLDRVVLFFHGNGEVVTDYLPWWPEQLAQMGASTALVEYRGYGGSTGTPLLSGMLDDGPRILDALGVSPERVVAFGRSVGSLYALHLASVTPNLGGLILESGIANVLERLLIRMSPRDLGCSLHEMEQAIQQRFDHDQKIRSYPGPTLILHADNDTLVDVSHAHRLAGWAGDRARCVIFNQGDHNSIFMENQDEYLAAVRDFLTSLPTPS